MYPESAQPLTLNDNLLAELAVDGVLSAHPDLPIGAVLEAARTCQNNPPRPRNVAALKACILRRCSTAKGAEYPGE